jgi:hypothetical protein
MQVEDRFFESFSSDEERAACAAKMERIRNVLDNRRIDYDAATVFRLALEGDEAVTDYLRLKGALPSGLHYDRNSTT